MMYVIGQGVLNSVATKVDVHVKTPWPSDFLAFVQKLRTCHSLFFEDQPCRPDDTPRVCKTEALFLRSLADKLSPETVYSIGDFAAPATSPSAQALKDIQVVYPWIEPMRRAYPDLPFYSFALHPQFLGLAWCWKCDCCIKATLMKIRKRYDPLYPWGGAGDDDGFGYDEGEED